jgi:hypothetical protein
MNAIDCTETGRRPTIQEALKAVEIMGRPGMVKYFPCDADSREMIIDELMCMTPSVEALRWLTSAMVRRVGEWRSLRELRLVLESRYTPLDVDRHPMTPWAYVPQLDDFEEVAKPLPLPAVAQEELPKLLAAAPVADRCPNCDSLGLLYSPGSTAPWQYCECESGARKRKHEPGGVSQANAAVAKLLRLSGRLVTPAAPLEVQHT